MSILSGFKKVRRHIRLPDGYKLLSFWTSSQTVEMDDGTTLESNKAKWEDASTKKHEHTNKPALDSITSEKVAKWNTLAESNVTGVKGNAESTYRTGNVNITPANIGLENVNNTSDSNKPISTATQNAIDTKVNKTGDTMSGTLTSSKTTSTHLAGNQGQAIINSTAGAGAYTMLDKLNSNNGYFTDGVYQNARMLYYTSKSTVSSGTNNITKSVTLLDENGNASFPGTITAPTFSGNATSAAKLSTAPAIFNSIPENLVSYSLKGNIFYTANAGYVSVASALQDYLNSIYISYSSSNSSGKTGYKINKEGYYFFKVKAYLEELSQTYEAVKRITVDVYKPNSTSYEPAIGASLRATTWETLCESSIWYCKSGGIVIPNIQMDGGATGKWNYTIVIVPLFIC